MNVPANGKKNIVGGILLMFTGGLMTLTPRYIFPTCGFSPIVDETRGAMMRCNSTGTVLVFLGVVSLCCALLLLASQKVSVRKWLLIVAGMSGGAVFPLFLVWPGVCRAATMPCLVGTLPAALLLGGGQVTIVVISILRELRK